MTFVFDEHLDLAVGTVAVPPSPADSGTTLTLLAGGGPYPAAPFYATLWPNAQTLQTHANSEVVRVLAMSGNVISSMERAQGGTIAQTVAAGWLFANSVTAEDIEAVEAAVNAIPAGGDWGDGACGADGGGGADRGDGMPLALRAPQGLRERRALV